MNNKRRKEIANAIRQIENVVSSILADEEEAFDNMPESLQGSERGDMSQEAQDNLSSAVDALEEAIICLEDASE
jgi:hypothetical protein